LVSGDDDAVIKKFTMHQAPVEEVKTNIIEDIGSNRGKVKLTKKVFDLRNNGRQATKPSLTNNFINE